jgi:hypothetical protein
MKAPKSEDEEGLKLKRLAVTNPEEIPEHRKMGSSQLNLYRFQDRSAGTTSRMLPGANFPPSTAASIARARL